MRRRSQLGSLELLHEDDPIRMSPPDNHYCHRRVVSDPYLVACRQLCVHHQARDKCPCAGSSTTGHKVGSTYAGSYRGNGQIMLIFEPDSLLDTSRGAQTYYFSEAHAQSPEDDEEELMSFAYIPSDAAPTADMSEIYPHENDVLMGRGGKNNQHPGNERLRQLARLYCEQYRVSKKKGKSDISRKLVEIMRNLDPPARFLRKDPSSRLWEDVGDDTAREKASQVLRDAVAIVCPGYTETSPQPSRLFAVPSLDETAATSSSFEGYAPVVPIESFPPPTPVQSRYKRARISQTWEETVPPRRLVADLSRGSAAPHAHRFSAGSDTVLHRPPAVLSMDRRNSSTATAGSLLGDLHADIQSGTLSEFDLFNGELLGAGDASLAGVPPNHHNYRVERSSTGGSVDRWNREWGHN